MFKSYYVVWKLQDIFTKNPKIIGLNRTMQYGNGAYQKYYLYVALWFKSYYVVWKHFFCHVHLCHSISLNRTMQYGNYTARIMEYMNYFGLNRTMQYGNLVLNGFLITALFSLNRTMQYGNRSGQRGFHAVANRFKSYYVVWKLFFHFADKSATVLFKSYYVVWKHTWTSDDFVRPIRLNRTMQYGNFFLSEAPEYQISFKSYYVVWKLSIVVRAGTALARV